MKLDLQGHKFLSTHWARRAWPGLPTKKQVIWTAQTHENLNKYKRVLVYQAKQENKFWEVLNEAFMNFETCSLGWPSHDGSIMIR